MEESSDGSIHNLWDHIKQSNIQVIGVPEEGKTKYNAAEESDQGIMAKNFPKLVKSTNPQIQNHQQTLCKINTKKINLRTL